MSDERYDIAAKFLKSLSEQEEVTPEVLEDLKGEFEKRKGKTEKVKERTEKETTDIRTLIADMNIAQRLKAAMFGDATVRGLLISDSNRMVQEAVLNNPQLREAEIEEFAKNKNMPQFVLRSISMNRAYMKNYTLKSNLVFNPKTPQDVSMKLIRHLNKNDLRRLAKSKGVPQVLTNIARKMLATADKH